MSLESYCEAYRKMAFDRRGTMINIWRRACIFIVNGILHHENALKASGACASKAGLARRVIAGGRKAVARRKASSGLALGSYSHGAIVGEA